MKLSKEYIMYIIIQIVYLYILFLSVHTINFIYKLNKINNMLIDEKMDYLEYLFKNYTKRYYTLLLLSIIIVLIFK